MSEFNDHETTIYGSYGEFETSEVSDFTDEEWAQYDAWVAESIAAYDERVEAEMWGWQDDYVDLDPEPPF